MLGWDSAATRLGLALEPGQRVGIGRDGIGQHLDRHFAAQPRISRPIHLPHPARAERREDLVRSEPCARGECHLDLFRLLT
jgi:hypothetical protein